YYCCGDRDYTNTVTGAGGFVFCSQWGQSGFDATSLGFDSTEATQAYLTAPDAFGRVRTDLFCR
ncbi:MAG: hypothetical protein AAFQ82_25030, partial [Myxococcota bacterium]